MKFLIDRCAGSRLAQWLQISGHDVVESRTRGRDPGDRILLQWAVEEQRILITIDTDFGKLVFFEQVPHCGMVRLPDVPAERRILFMQELLARHEKELAAGAVITIRGGRIRISNRPSPPAG